MTKRTFTIQLPTDSNGLVGRQCTKIDCSKYFKVKPGTGLSKPTQAFCPYCGHAVQRAPEIGRPLPGAGPLVTLQL
jgi:rRNA maturation endonuclease Nob1